MGIPFWTKKQKGLRTSQPFLKSAPVDPKGQRLIGFTSTSREPIWAPLTHSLLLSANGGGKTTRGLMPWLFSLLASTSRPAILMLDSKQGEIAAQCCPMLEKLGVPTAVIDESRVLPPEVYGRMPLNPLESLVWTHRHAPEDQVFANDLVTQTLIEEPSGGIDRNLYWRQSPRAILEFAIYALLKRSPELATPGGVWTLISSTRTLRAVAEVELEEGEGILKALAEEVLDMLGHEHGPQHLQAARQATRLFAAGTRLHMAGHGAKRGHGDLIRGKRVIFLCGDQSTMQSMGSFYGLHLMSFLRAAYMGAGPLWIGADEFSNAPTKRLAEMLTTLRAYGTSVAMVAQSRSEIERKLGKNELFTIEEQAVLKQWFGFSSFEEAERVSKAMGEEHAVGATLGGNSHDMRVQTNINLFKQPIRTAAELMAMPRNRFLGHVKGLGFFEADTVSQANIAPYCDLCADNPLEGGRLPADPWITLTLPEEARS
ncbi:MAG: TraM recognition domain-containing protein [Pseudomonadota bacterium]